MPPKRKTATKAPEEEEKVEKKVEKKEEEKEEEEKKEIFDGLVFSFFGFAKDEAALSKSVTENGARVLKTVTKNVTHLVATKEAIEEGGAKLTNALKNGIFIVSKQFVEHSVSAGKKVDEKKYDLTPEEEKEEEETKEEKKTEESTGKRRGRSADKEKAEKKQKVDDDDDEPPAKTSAPAATTTASAAPTATVEPPKLAKVIRKGRAAVDTIFGQAANYHVFEEGSDIYDVMLNQTNIGNNNNKFYVIQLLESDSGGSYYVWNRWGRVGEKGQNKALPCPNLSVAKSEFRKKFREKSGNDWEDRSSFEPVHGKYTLIEIDYGADEEKEKKNKPSLPKNVNIPESKLEKKVQDFISLIFDIKMMEKTLVEMEYDLDKNPLGKLTKKQIMDGYAVLQKIDAAIKANNKKDLDELSSRFYTLIPHSFGRTRPPIIKNDEDVKRKLQMLEALVDIEIATKIISETSATENPIDLHYSKLNNELRPIDSSSEEYKMVKKYVEASNRKGQMYKLELLELFAAQRKGDKERYEPFKKLGNRRLLWHGSRLSNYVGILSQGLRIAPPEAPVSGYRFGKGMYFADIMSLSANYCRVDKSSPVGCMLLFDTALGKMYECPKDEYMDKPKAGFDSTWALGTIEPDPAGNVSVPEGYVVPCGTVQPSPYANKGVSCYEHQFICYNEAQASMKYVMTVKWHFGK